MTKTNNLTNLRNGLLASILFFFFAATASALPGTGVTNLQTTTGVTVDQGGNTLTITSPDKAVLSWNNFGSGTDAIGFGETIKYVLPSAKGSVLNVVNGGQSTTINGTIESNGGVYILNPNGIVVGNGARIDTARLVLSSVDSPFAGQYKFMQDGTLPSESGTRTAAGFVNVTGTAQLLTPNILINTKDLAFYGGLTSGNLTVNADGNVNVGSGVAMAYVSGTLTINNPTGTTTLGQQGGYNVGANTAIVVTTDTGTITNPVGSAINTRLLNLTATNGTISVVGASAPSVIANGKNVSVAFAPTIASVTFGGSANGGNLAVTASGALTLDGVKNIGAGTSTFTAGGKLTLANVHIDSSGASVFTGTSVADSKSGLFVYGPTLFAATTGDIAITGANNSFGPLSISAPLGNAAVNESATINLNTVNAKEVVLKTKQAFFQTPTTFTLAATKLSLETAGDVSFLGGTITNGLTITAGAGNVDLSKLTLTTNLNNVAPTVTTTGTVTNPIQ